MNRRPPQIDLRARSFHLQIKISQWDERERYYDKSKAKSFTVQVGRILSNLGAVCNGRRDLQEFRRTTGGGL
jgi:hypothetical protein